MTLAQVRDAMTAKNPDYASEQEIIISKMMTPIEWLHWELDAEDIKNVMLALMREDSEK